ncbi:MAG: hypothetical protein P1U86_15460 [Verrucomicrobiales bacterium]|nr:hypothetical protein [Verrucomicrobiales bacterium]
MKKQSTLAVLLPILFLTACGSKPKNLIYSGMTTSSLIEKYGEPVRKEASDDGSETWFYKAQRFVDSASQEQWSTDTASPHFSESHSDPGKPSDGTSLSVSRTLTTETVGIPIRNGEVTKAAPADLKIIGGR